MCSENSTSSCPSQGLSLCFSLKHFVVDSLGTIGDSKVRYSSLKSVAPRCSGTREADNIAQGCRAALPVTDMGFVCRLRVLDPLIVAWIK